jgi:hypothetical protein
VAEADVARNGIAVTVQIKQSAVVGKRLVLAAMVEVNCLLPEQNEQLPYLIEVISEEAGQHLKRGMFRQGIEIADRELVIKLRTGKEGKGIQRIGKRCYTFKTCFATVVVKRIRIRHKSDGSTQVPAARVWRLPRQRCITTGLKIATCELAGKQSYGSSVRQLERDTGEAKILSKSSVGNILHAAGRELAAANEGRASAVYAADESAKQVLGRAEEYLAETFFENIWLADEELTEENAAELYDEIAWDPREQMELEKGSNAACAPEEVARPELTNQASLSSNNSADSAATTGLIILQADEVVVASQEQEGGKYLVNYSAVVRAAQANYYFSALTAPQLFHQVGGLLANLQAHAPAAELLLISDCAEWIRRWYESVAIANKQSILCWWHLKKKCARPARASVLPNLS